MKTLHFGSKIFEAELIIKGEDYIKGVNLEGFQVFLITGISDFSHYALSPNEKWDLPIEPEKINATNVKLNPIVGITAETVHQGIEKLVTNIESRVKTVNSIVPDEHGDVNIPHATTNQKGTVSLDGRTISTNANGDIEATVPNYFEFDYGITSYVPLAFEGYAGDTVDGSLFQVYVGNEEMRKRIVDMDISIIPLGDTGTKAHRVNMNVSWERDEDGSFINLYYTTENSQFNSDGLGVYLYKNGEDCYLTIDIRKANTFNGTSTTIGVVNRTTIRGTQDIVATYEDIEPFNVDIVLTSQVLGLKVNTFVNETPISSDASKTHKGIMQVGEGLKVSNGVVSVDNNIDESYGISTPIENLPLGITEVSIPIVATDKNYVDLRSLVSTLMGYELTSVAHFRFFMKTIKRSNAVVRQEVVVTSNYTLNIGVEYFRLHREIVGAEFKNWQITVSTITGKGSPQNVVYAFKGCLYFDAVNGKLYKKTVGTTVGNSTGWEEVITPKEFSSIANNSNITIGSAPFDLKLNARLGGTIPYDASTGEFTLTGNKTYRIHFTANINTTGRLEIRVVNSAGVNVNPFSGVWSKVGSDTSPNMYSVIISPSITTNYKLRVTAHSVASSTLSTLASHLEIIEM